MTPPEAGPRRVTVLVPTYNRSSFVRHAVESVLAQDFDDVCVVVVDDASTDDTAAVVASFADPRVQYRRQPHNLGWHGNCNSAFEGVTSEFVTWLGDDDSMLPGALSRAVRVMDDRGSVGIAHAAFNYVSSDGDVIAAGANLTRDLSVDTFETGATYLRKAMRYGTRICTSTALVRTAAVTGTPFDPEEGPTADAGLWMRIALSWDVHFLAQAGLNYRLHQGSDSAIWSRMAGDRYRPTMKLVRKVRWMKLRFIDEHHDQLTSPSELRMIVHLSTARSVVARAVPNSVAAFLRQSGAITRVRDGLSRRVRTT
jgi:glycosyltransferase involved in cell wall biosynthesis